ncbi:MAG: hypothetical protein U0103_01365 [Candidatus Obscuribacterales bacterium]
MKSIQREQVLRLNCPGFGEESYLTIGKAKPLDNYDVIIANPVSILHLFDRDPEVLKEINGKLDEGLTSFTLKNDSLLQALESDLKKRIFELVSFLERGGLLVYYLCRPFLLQGSSLSMDNYFWLESLAPDTPVENNVRHMSAVSHGRTIEPTEQAEKTEFASYFQQTGLEWNTIIRTDFLTEGYIVLATAGPRKCIAAHLIAGDNGGRIVFLPAPYSPDFDRTLMDCVNSWYNKRNGESVPEVAENSGSAQKFPQPDTSFLKPEQTPTIEKQTPSKPAPSPASVGSAQAAGSAVTAGSAAVAADVGAGTAAATPSPSHVVSNATAAAAQPITQPEVSAAKAVSASPGASAIDTAVPTAARSGAAPGLEAPGTSRTGMPASTLSPSSPRTEIQEATVGSPNSSRTGLPSQNPTTSRTGLPPVQKFDARVSRSQPHGPSDTDSAKKKMTAEEILESVSAQAEVAEATERQPFNERTTADIAPNFTTQPQQNVDAAGVPSAADLLKELESVGTKGSSAEESKDDEGAEEGSRNLLQEMENLAGPVESKSEPPAVEGISDKSSTDFSNYKFAAESTNVGDPGYKFGIAEPPAAAAEPPKIAATNAGVTNTRGPGSDAKTSAPSATPQVSKPEPAQPVKAASYESGNNNHETETPEAKDLMKKMEEMTKTAPSGWCAEYSFSDLDDLRREKSALVDSIKQAQEKISSIDTKISQLDGLKNALLAAEGEELTKATALVFKRLGWSAGPNSPVASELLLSADRPEAIVRVLRTNSQPKSSDIAQLAQSVITFWGEHEVEPKGVLVSCTWADKPPSERSEPDYSDALADFAHKKNLALMTTMQLLCIYRDLEMGIANSDEVRKRILETNGKLVGFSLEHTMTKVAAG